MARLCTLFSGSSGNCSYISWAGGSVLVDAGASLKSIKREASLAGADLNNLKAVFVTHTHSDHISGLRVLLNNYNIPLVATKVTADILINEDLIPPKTEIIEIDGGAVQIADIEVSGFATSHDAEGSCGYTFLLPGEKKVAVCTDLGVVTEEVRNAVTGSNAVIIESNHDVTMLKNGPYPPYLKLRIMSDKGHLSNNACAAELPALINSGTTRFVLAHLSRKNNLPQIAFNTAKTAFALAGADESDYILKVAPVTAGEMLYL